MLVEVRQVTYGGDSGNRIFVLYWRCSFIRVFVIGGSTVFRIVSNINFSFEDEINILFSFFF
jgi:hypothetical protein